MAVKVGQALSWWQKLIALKYGDGDYAHVAEWSQERLHRELKNDPDQFGDTLFVFLMRELDPKESCDGWEEAIRRIVSAKTQLKKLLFEFDQVDIEADIPF